MEIRQVRPQPEHLDLFSALSRCPCQVWGPSPGSDFLDPRLSPSALDPQNVLLMKCPVIAAGQASRETTS
eukprot:1155125-Pelagomonas_calceolata.AAC.7